MYQIKEENLAPTADSVSDYQASLSAITTILNSGITVLASPADELIQLDIIAVHGLLGSPEGTWTADNGNMWLKQLGEELPFARICTFGYDSSVFTSSFMDITAAATLLLNELNRVHAEFGPQRPIMFICHSLGGIVVKKALTIAHHQTPDLYERSLSSIKAIAFLGVPHAGSSMAGPAFRLASLNFFRYLFPTNNRLLNLLRTDSPELHEISRFSENRLSSMKILSFYETKMTNGYQIVDQNSARIHTEELLPVEADHISICKVEEKNDSRWNTVVEPIIRLAKETIYPREKKHHSESSAMHNDKSVITQLIYSVNAADTIKTMGKPIQGSCNWILDHREFVQWLDGDRGVLWIEGTPSSGKSYLCKYLVEYCQMRNAPTNTCYFFCNSNLPMRITVNCIIRCIIHQLFVQNPGLFKHALPAWEVEKEKMIESNSTLVEILEACLNDPNLGRTFIIIDALDQCSDEENIHYLDWITSVLDRKAEGSTALRVIITSRTGSLTLPLGFNRYRTALSPSNVGNRSHQKRNKFFIRLDDEDKTKEGVESYFRDGVENLGKDAETTDSVIRAFRNHSVTSYLWASTALKKLSQCNPLSLGKAENILSSLPHGPDSMYNTIFKWVSVENRSAVRTILQIIVAANEHVTIDDLNWICAVQEAEECNGELENLEKFKVDRSEMIRDLCVLSIKSNKVEPSHGSLIEKVTNIPSNPESSPMWYQITIQESKRAILKYCVLRLDLFDRTLKSGAVHRESLSFLQYTLKYWHSHFSDIQQEVDPTIFEKVKGFYTKPELFRCWREVYNMFRQQKERERILQSISEAQKMTMSTELVLNELIAESRLIRRISTASKEWMALHLRHSSIFFSLLTDNSHADSVIRINEKLEDGWTPLCIAIDSGDVAVVQKLLNQNGINESPMEDGRVALHLAANADDFLMAKSIIEKCVYSDIDVRTKPKCLTPLHIAAAGGKRSIVELLLTKGASHALVDDTGSTPLHLAAANGHQDTCALLIRNGSACLARDEKGRTPLVVAAEKGQTAAVIFFLEDASPENRPDDHHNILHASVRSNNPIVIEKLLDRGLSATEKDDLGFTPFAYIDSSCEIQIIERFLKQGADINEQGKDGLTLVHRLAASNMVESVRYLLDKYSERILVEARGRSVLHSAVFGGAQESMLRLLVDRGQEINAASKDGDMPIHVAVKAWRSQNTVRVLQELGANIDAKNGLGETPLQMAVQRQNAGLVVHLVRNKANPTVMREDGLDILTLAEMSFLLKFHQHREARLDSYRYSSFLMTHAPVEDDNLYQKEDRTVGEVDLMKIRDIKDALLGCLKGERLPEKRHGFELQITMKRMDAPQSDTPAPQVAEIAEAATAQALPSAPIGGENEEGMDGSNPPQENRVESPADGVVDAGSKVTVDN